MRNRDTDRGPYIRTASGVQVFLNDPTPEQLSVKDAVMHLSGIRRFNGIGISVAQHMVVGARMAKRYYWDFPALPRQFLIHDFAEYIVGDVSSPFKRLLPDFRAIEEGWHLAVEEKFNQMFLLLPAVRELDDRMWLTERLITQPMLCREDDYPGDLLEFDLDEEELHELFTPWSTETAEFEYAAALAESGLLT